jgi:hypothetical protein
LLPPFEREAQNANPTNVSLTTAVATYSGGGNRIPSFCGGEKAMFVELVIWLPEKIQVGNCAVINIGDWLQDVTTR